MQHIEVEREISAPPERVFEVIADHRGWARWSGAKEVVLRNEGDPAPNGLGAIRVMRGGGLAIEEEVTGFDPPKRMEYRISGGLPIRDHRAEMRLEPCAAGTRLVWTAEFSARIPLSGALLRRALQRALEQMADALSRQF